MPLEFRYFRAPETEMIGLLSDVRTCSLCGQPGRCFSLNSVIGCGLTQEERQGKIGCVDCLKRDRFSFSHRTEAGYIGEDGLMAYDIEEEQERVFIVGGDGQTTTTGGYLVQPPQEQVSDEAVAELRRTPKFSTWQDLDWQVHHSDFMAYLGIWEPEDFERLAEPGSGRNSYLKVVDPEWSNLWPEGEEPIFSDNIVMFECLHCSKKVGIPDFD